MRRHIALTVLIFVIVPLTVHAQEGNGPVSNDESSAVSSPLSGGTTAFSAEIERTNYLDVGVGVLSTYDDNVLNVASGQESDIAHNILPSIALRQSHGRLNWNLSYAGGFTIHQRFSSYNQGLHSFGLDTVYKVAEHTDLSVRDHFTMSTGFFDQVSGNPTQPQGSILQQPNQSVIVPLARQNSNIATVQLNNQFSASSAIGASGTFYRSYYKDAPSDAGLIDTNSQEAEAYYNRRLSGRHSLGLTYRYQKFTFSPLANDTTTHSVLVTYTLRLQPNMSLSFFAGPQHTDTANQMLVPSVTLPRISVLAIPFSQNSWSGAGGASYVWNGTRTGITVDAARFVSDGGGLLGAVTLTTADAGFRYQLSRRTTAGFGFNYGTSDAMGAISTPYSSIESASGSVSISRQIRGGVGLTLGYGRAFQSEGNLGSTNGEINHNRAWIGLSYQFSRPLGQ